MTPAHQDILTTSDGEIQLSGLEEELKVGPAEEGVAEAGVADEPYWEGIFCRLDVLDGARDGRICRASLLSWLDTLSLQESITLEVNQGVGRHRLEELVRGMDRDRDGYISRGEFLDLVEGLERRLEQDGRRVVRYLRIAAYADTYRWWPAPLFSLLLAAALLVVFLHQSLLLAKAGPAFSYPSCSPLALHPLYRTEVWRHLSYSLAHHGPQHLTVNLLLLLLVSLPLEMTHGWARVALLYTAAVLAASLTHSLVRPCGSLVGCSAGVYALSTAHLASLLLNWREDNLVLRQRLSNRRASAPTFGWVVRVCRLLVVAGILMVDVISSLAREGGSTSYTAHLTGSGLGLLLGLVLLRNRKVQTWEVGLRRLAAGLSALLLVSQPLLSSHLYLFPPPSPPASLQVVLAALNAALLQGEAVERCREQGARLCPCVTFQQRHCPGVTAVIH